MIEFNVIEFIKRRKMVEQCLERTRKEKTYWDKKETDMPHNESKVLTIKPSPEAVPLATVKVDPA